MLPSAASLSNKGFDSRSGIDREAALASNDTVLIAGFLTFFSVLVSLSPFPFSLAFPLFFVILSFKQLFFFELSLFSLIIESCWPLLLKAAAVAVLCSTKSKDSVLPLGLNSVPRRTFTIKDCDRFLRPAEAGVGDVIIEDEVSPGNDMKSVETLDIDGRQLLKIFQI